MGLAIAEEVAGRGADVVVSYGHDADAAADAVKRLLALGVRAEAVSADATSAADTPFFHGQETEDSVRAIVAFTPMRRLGRPADIAPVVGFLLSDRAGWVTGQVIRANGGQV